MFNLSAILQQAQGGRGIENLAAQFGLRPDQASSAIDALLPMLSAGLQQKTQEPGGLADIFGGVLNNTHQQAYESAEAVADGSAAADGEDMLARIFGTQQASPALAAHAAEQTGLNPGILQSMLPAIISMVMGGLFKGMQNQGMGQLLEKIGQAGGNAPGNSSGGLGDILGQILSGQMGGQPQARDRGQAGSESSGLGGLLGGLLGGMFGGGAQRQPQAQAPQQAQKPDQIFPGGMDMGNLQQGIDILGQMLNPGGNAGQGRQGGQQGAQTPNLQDLLGQILGGGRR